MRQQLLLLPEYLTAHVQLTLLALLFSTGLSIPLGITATRVRWLEQLVLGLASTVQTIPSLALLAIMVPLLAAVNLQSIGFLPAIVGLTLYGILPILRNTVTGISGVDPALKEAAKGVGMTARQQLIRVELPLAMPVIVAGIRTSTVWIVGIATLSTPVGATSLGNYIFSGLQTRNYPAIMIGCVAAAGLAWFLDGLIRSIEVGLRTRRRGPVFASLTMVAVLGTYSMVTLATPLMTAGSRPITIGSKTFTEQYILSAMLAEWIQSETERSTTLTQSLGSTVAFDALAAGDIDVYVDYSGTLWANELGRSGTMTNRHELLDDVRQFLQREHGITLVATLGFENAYVLAVRGNDAAQLGLREIGDLRLHAPSLAIGGDYEFFARPEWPAIRTAYNLEFKTQRTMDATLMYQAVVQGDVDVISGFSTDGRIASYGLVVLEDDLGAIPPYDAVVLASARVTREAPEVLAALTKLDNRISVEQMRAMNFAVDEASKNPGEVASGFLRQLEDE